MSATTFHATIATPLGAMRLATDGRAILALEYDAPDAPPSTALPPDVRRLADDLQRHLDGYFAGECVGHVFTLAPAGTPFQRSVWDALLGIPHGETVGYGEIARRVGRPAAVRAVGAANGSNPIAILIPCHRVIGSDGTLTGYGGGLDRKRKLLALEAPRPFAGRSAA
jgi:methylated-DNA-[protein]-cysteine S-methyltransferase